MSYSTVDQLAQDPAFGGRVRACTVEQAAMFATDTKADHAALADDVQRGGAETSMAFIRLAAAGPGIGDKVDTGAGTIDQSLVTDADLLALTQGNWPTVAGLYFTEDGAPV
jgi:hypothetical protein